MVKSSLVQLSPNLGRGFDNQVEFCNFVVLGDFVALDRT